MSAGSLFQNFEGRTQDDALADERRARRAAWNLAINVLQIRGNLDQDRAILFIFGSFGVFSHHPQLNIGKKLTWIPVPQCTC